MPVTHKLQKMLAERKRFAELGNGIKQMAWIFQVSETNIRAYLKKHSIEVYKKRKMEVYENDKMFFKFRRIRKPYEPIDPPIKHTIMTYKKSEPFKRPPPIYSNRSPFGIADELRKLEYAV